MPEYLSPGVYVEETNTGNKPIEGVSTSTTGLVGVTERGPVNVPILVTSIGEYRRMFGGYLPVDEFTEPLTGRVHAYMPHAIEGFFTNGGKRAYVVRALTRDAVRANRRMFFADPTVINPMPVVLMHSAEEGTGTTTNPPLLHVAKPPVPPALAATDIIRIGDGSRAEYRTIVTATDDDYASVDLPLQNAHALGASVYDFDRATADDTTDYGTPEGFTVVGGALAGSTSITLTHSTPADLTKLQTILSVPGASQLLEINTAAAEGGSPPPKTAPWTEYVFATGAKTTAAGVTVTLSTPLQRSYPPPHDPLAAVPATKVSALKIPAPGAVQHLTIAANGGDSILYFDTGSFTTPGDLIVIDQGLPNQEVRRVGELAQLSLATAPYEAYPVGSVVALVSMKDDDRTVSVAPPSTKSKVYLEDVSALVPGMTLVSGADTGVIASVDTTTSPPSVTLLSPLTAAPSGGAAVIVQPRKLTAPATKGSVVVSLDARIGLTGALEVQPGDVLRIGNPSNLEYAIVSSLSDPRVVAPDAGSIVLESPLAFDHAFGEPVHRQKPVFPDTSRHPTLTLQNADESSTSLLVGDGFNYAMGEIVSVTTPMGDVHFHVLGGSALKVTLSAITLDKALIRSHDAGATVVKREPLFEVRALDAGDWGNRVLVTAEQEETGLLPRAEVVSGTASPSPGVPSTLRLKTVTGIEAGTILELRDATNTTQIGDFLKVKGIDRAANNLVILDAPGLSAAQVGAIAAAGSNPLVVRSREFRMQVFLLQRPSPAAPTRNEDIQDRELFRNLSMDERHSRYFERIIGATFDDGAALDDLGQPMRIGDRRSEGGSQYIRVDDLMSTSSDRERVRLGPEVLFDLLPSGLTRPARFRLGEGESLAHFGGDAVNTMNDKMYTGDDDLEPAHRTGIYALKNVQDISLVACPGQTTPFVQQGLIDHCEALRYRFAVLDAQGPDRDTIDDIQAQRQQYDSKYAAFYHPWLTIPDPFPTNLATIGQLPIPPSGHVLGIYANVDDTRGVHKAPANEVVLGITGLTRYLQQPEQDVLNAYPVNIDVIRDFRSNNRAIRVWGARCITSDPDWKYVNVRRLMIFIEDSIDRGLQWVVFEPNAEELWARVRRSVSNFLTTVWRNGALEGTTKDQAFYVKCDRTTMTQDDIDNGRLICVIGIAPVKPAEFVIIRIGLWTADASS